MPKIKLGINTEFAKRRWSKPEEWLDIIHSKLELNLCNLSLDVFDPHITEPTKSVQLRLLDELCEEHDVHIYSTRVGEDMRSKNLLFHPDLEMRIQALNYFEKSVDIAAGIESVTIGGYLGALNDYYLKNKSKAANLIAFYKDSIEYLSKLSYEAGLNSFTFELPQIENGTRANFDYISEILNKNESTKFKRGVVLYIRDLILQDLNNERQTLLFQNIDYVCVRNPDDFVKFQDEYEKKMNREKYVFIDYQPNFLRSSEEELENLMNTVDPIKNLI